MFWQAFLIVFNFLCNRAFNETMKNEYDFSTDLRRCLGALAGGGLILYPTDTVWGIGCDATNAQAVQKIYDLKKRSETKAMIILVASANDVFKYVTQPSPSIMEFLKKVERPTTVVYDCAVGIADNLLGPDGTIAIRVVSEIFCIQLIKQFGRPIVSTSANTAGSAAPGNFAEVPAYIKEGVDFVVNYRREEEGRRLPSRVVRLLKDGNLEVLRP